MIGGVAILEDAHHNTARLDACRPLHGTARRREPRIREVVDAQTAVQSRVLSSTRWARTSAALAWTQRSSIADRPVNTTAGPDFPSIQRIFVRNLNTSSYGNAMGIGMADVTTERLVRDIDWEATTVNALSSGIPSRFGLPAHFASDRECLQWVAATAGKMNPDDVTFGWIRNTLALDRVAVSVNLRARLDGEAHVDVVDDIETEWDEQGNLVSPSKPKLGSEEALPPSARIVLTPSVRDTFQPSSVPLQSAPRRPSNQQTVAVRSLRPVQTTSTARSLR